MSFVSPPSSTTATRLVRIHLYGYNGPHPAAANHILEFTIIPDEWGNMMSLSIPQVSDNILSHYYYGLDEQGDSQSRVLIWDWKTSELLLDSSTYFPALLPTIGSVFYLLDSTYFLILSELDSGSINLCKLFRPSSTATVSVIHLASLLLPPMAEGVRLNRSFSTHAASRSAKPFVDKHLFEGNPEDQLHVFTLTYTNGYYPLDRHNLPIYPAIDLFVHRHVFTKYSRMGELSGNPAIVPWAEWGPSNARIIHPSRTQTWTPGLRDIHEQRAILQTVKIRHPFAKSNTIEILDFSKAIVSPVKQGLVQSRSLLPPSIIRTSDILLFRDDVETHLPCVSFAAQFPEDYSFFLIHALGVIGLSYISDCNVTRRPICSIRFIFILVACACRNVSKLIEENAANLKFDARLIERMEESVFEIHTTIEGVLYVEHYRLYIVYLKKKGYEQDVKIYSHTSMSLADHPNIQRVNAHRRSGKNGVHTLVGKITPMCGDARRMPKGANSPPPTQSGSTYSRRGGAGASSVPGLKIICVRNSARAKTSITGISLGVSAKRIAQRIAQRKVQCGDLDKYRNPSMFSSIIMLEAPAGVVGIVVDMIWLREFDAMDYGAE
ncbi:hypothetical protein BDN70DRAFT_947626 [Pholiota conissans]|uniref:Uncharacterized protein n=1 Tax=Pholiota conissans TaxID=109636 RepID=A0A9P5YYB4_9AGAR|nr:hypothetical protein BDN70DRAFT_947626 [Pholiota conissans]